MPETFSTQLAGLAGYADRNASLAPAAALRGRAARRTLRRRGGAAALLGGGALAIAISLGVTNTGVVMPAHSTASSAPGSVPSPGSVRLTADQTTVLAKAHVTKGNLAVLKKMHLTPLQIKALAPPSALLTPRHRTRRPPGQRSVITLAVIRAAASEAR